nr:MAG TPA: hypothetical protein [Caudoviricetes sp.]
MHQSALQIRNYIADGSSPLQNPLVSVVLSQRDNLIRYAHAT